ncbi:MAG TPA: HAMP domain-containing sensor histidine kinase [Acetivibrio sp.]|nr:HAMP domain-containing sensor histidine kinase [Acetivibrio sp.]
MSFFRNPEIKTSLFVFCILTLLSTGLGFVFDYKVGIYTLAVCLIFSLGHIIITYRRYSKISGLSREIDSILHGKDSMNLDEYSEGELAILGTEIQKLTIRLREQNGALQRDKTYLADSIADISHQIRTTLTSINILISLLSKTNLSEERRLEIVREIEMLLIRIDWLISALLKMSRLDAGTVKLQRKTVSVAELIKQSVAPIAIPMELREQQIEIRMKGDETYEGDFAWSVEAIGNILKNCMEHMQKGGRIVIEASENPVFTEIVISDNGPGIDKEDLPHLFERFYKGKNSGDQSIGIGLALARMIITSQNGTVRAGNNSDRGARFTVRFYKGETKK